MQNSIVYAEHLLEGSSIVEETEDYELRAVAPNMRRLEQGVTGTFINYLLVSKERGTIELFGGMFGWMQHQLKMIQQAHDNQREEDNDDSDIVITEDDDGATVLEFKPKGGSDRRDH